MFRGRALLLSRAVTRSDLKQCGVMCGVRRRRVAERALAAKDQRNLYLLEEGLLTEETRGDMNDRGGVWRAG